jgi:hypothetical protein
MKKVYSAGDELEAQIVQGLLEAVEIEVVVHGQTMHAARGSVPFYETYPSVWVRDEDVERAEQVVQGYRERRHRREAGAHWRCSGCGERIEGQFTHCWKCGADRAGPEEPVPAEPVERLVLDYDPSVESDLDWSVDDEVVEPEEPMDEAGDGTTR